MSVKPLSPVNLNWAWEMHHPWDQETFPRRSKDQSPVEHRVKGLWPSLIVTTYPPHGPCAPMSVLVGSFFEESYLFKVTQGSSEGPDR